MAEQLNRSGWCNIAGANRTTAHDLLALLFKLLTFFACVPVAFAQSTIRVPLNFPTIQAAINAAVAGDTVLVAPGTYVENIDFIGKGITLRSESGANATIIDGNSNGAVVAFVNGEGASSRLIGFTIRNGRNYLSTGGGIRIISASPQIQENVIVSNHASDGAGIVIHSSGSPLIERNIITGNLGHGIRFMFSEGSAQIQKNVIAFNTASGISMWSVESPLIEDNILFGNLGIGIETSNTSAKIVQNLVVGNGGGGISWSSTAPGHLVANNTIVDNDGLQASGVYADGYDADARLINNIIIGKSGQSALYCGNFNDPNPPIVQFNNAFSPGGIGYSGLCANALSANGNISANPLFIDAASGNYRLGVGSPSIDAGSNSVQGLPGADIEGLSRIRDGDGNGVATVDMGAYEFSTTPRSLVATTAGNNFGSFLPGVPAVSRIVTVSNTGPTSVTLRTSTLLSNDSASFSLSSGGPNPCVSFTPTLGPGTSCTLMVTFAPVSAGDKKALFSIIPDNGGAPVFVPFSATQTQSNVTPNLFSFLVQQAVPGSVVVSDSQTITGLSVPADIWVVGGEYSINGGPFTAQPGMIQNGQTVVVRHRASTNYNDMTSAVLSVGTRFANFWVRTPNQVPPPAMTYLPLTIGNSWLLRSGGVVGSASTITDAQIINDVAAYGIPDGFDGSVTYFSNDAINGVRAHRVITPSIFIQGCGTVTGSETYSPPVTIIPGNVVIGQTVSSNGTLTLVAGKCLNVLNSVFGYVATSALETIERVVVAAGQFDALKVRLTISVPVEGITNTAVVWFAPGVGQVKAQYDDGTVEELVSTNITRTTPDAFAFAPQSNVPINTQLTSSAVTISGITAAAPVSIVGGEYSINGGAFTNLPGSVTNGQSIRLRLTSPAQGGANVSANLTVGGVVGTFSVATGIGGPGAPTSMTARTGFGSITVTFAAPANNGGAAITGYTVTCTSSNGGVSRTVSVSATTTSLQVGGVTNGKSYTCTVTAANSVGTGVTSAPSSPIVPIDITPILNLLLMDD